MAERTFFNDDMSRLYGEHWGLWARHRWGMLRQVVTERAPQARNWLELCCGTGDLLALVTRSGYDAVGVDISPNQLEHARAKAPEASFFESDILALDLSAKFDVVTCMFDSLNYLVSLEDLDRATRIMAAHLENGGVLVFDLRTRASYQAETPRMVQYSDATVMFEYPKGSESSLFTIKITGFILESDGRYRRFQEAHPQRGFELAEVDGILANSPLVFERYDGDSGGLVTPDAKRLLYICQHKTNLRSQ